MTTDALPRHALVACLCAQWCGVCRSFRPTFQAMALQFPQVDFLWVDVEDESELVDPLDIENFPTLLTASGDELRFLGTITPHSGTLERLINNTLGPQAARYDTALPAQEVVRRLNDPQIRSRLREGALDHE